METLVAVVLALVSVNVSRNKYVNEEVVEVEVVVSEVEVVTTSAPGS